MSFSSQELDEITDGLRNLNIVTLKEALWKGLVRRLLYRYDDIDDEAYQSVVNDFSSIVTATSNLDGSSQDALEEFKFEYKRLVDEANSQPNDGK